MNVGLHFILFCFYLQVLSETARDSAVTEWIQGLKSKGRRIYSQNDEDGVIEEIFNFIGTTNKIYVEFGASDGQECNTRLLRCEGIEFMIMIMVVIMIMIIIINSSERMAGMWPSLCCWMEAMRTPA